MCFTMIQRNGKRMGLQDSVGVPFLMVRFGLGFFVWWFWGEHIQSPVQLGRPQGGHSVCAYSRVNKNSRYQTSSIPTPNPTPIFTSGVQTHPLCRQQTADLSQTSPTKKDEVQFI